MKIGIINYNMGNMGSVKRKLDLLGYDNCVSSDINVLEKTDKLILPGVGHFASAVHQLKSLKLWDKLNDWVYYQKKPILGICLGMQLMAKHSEEGNEYGFGWLDANVIKFKIADKKIYKVPHMGWNNIKICKENPLTFGINQKDEFYFIHSFYIKYDNNQDVIAESNYDEDFVAAIQHENIFGVQFHPEKSHDAGIMVLNNFIKMRHV